jgi:hypothetical protein
VKSRLIDSDPARNHASLALQAYQFSAKERKLVAYCTYGTRRVEHGDCPTRTLAGEAVIFFEVQHTGAI